MKKPTIRRLIEFQKLLLKFSHIERVIHRTHPNQSDYTVENDTEHSYNLALTAWYLAGYFPELDRDLVIRLALVHDLVEIHAGDTYIYADEVTLASKVAREAKALIQLEQEWADFPDMTQHIKAYEHRSTPEAKFVYALDKIMPMMTIFINDGYTWKQEDITLTRLKSVKESKVALSPEVIPYYNELCKILEESPHLIPIK